MEFYYCDSSALVKHFAEERGSGRMRQLMAEVEPQRLVSSVIAWPEISSALSRKRGVDLYESDFMNAIRELAARSLVALSEFE